MTLPVEAAHVVDPAIVVTAVANALHDNQGFSTTDFHCGSQGEEPTFLFPWTHSCCVAELQSVLCKSQGVTVHVLD